MGTIDKKTKKDLSKLLKNYPTPIYRPSFDHRFEDGYGLSKKLFGKSTEQKKYRGREIKYSHK